jgi:hypothetical protein
MFDLEAALRDWKNTAENSKAQKKPRRGRPSLNTGELAELEDHLREEFARLVAAGQSPECAWSTAIAQLGDPAEISAEFAKLDRLSMFDLIMLCSIVGYGVYVIRSMAGYASALGFADLILGVGQAMVYTGIQLCLLATVIAAYGILRSATAPAATLPLTRVSVRLIGRISSVAAMLILLGFGVLAIRDITAGGMLGEKLWLRYLPLLLGSAATCACLLAAAVTARRAHIAPKFPLASSAAAGGLALLTWMGPSMYHARSLKGLYALLAFGGCIICIVMAALSRRLRDDPAISQ